MAVPIVPGSVNVAVMAGESGTGPARGERAPFVLEAGAAVAGRRVEREDLGWQVQECDVGGGAATERAVVRQRDGAAATRRAAYLLPLLMESQEILRDHRG
jgi:hypothetical protein